MSENNMKKLGFMESLMILWKSGIVIIKKEGTKMINFTSLLDYGFMRNALLAVLIIVFVFNFKAKAIIEFFLKNSKKDYVRKNIKKRQKTRQ